jgi:hypothetical protein
MKWYYVDIEFINGLKWHGSPDQVQFDYESRLPWEVIKNDSLFTRPAYRTIATIHDNGVKIEGEVIRATFYSEDDRLDKRPHIC